MLSFLCCALQKLCWYVIRDFSDQLKVMHYNLTLKELWVIQNSSSVFGKRMQKRRHKKELLFFFTFSMCVYECVSVEGVDSTPASSLLLFFTKKKERKREKSFPFAAFRRHVSCYYVDLFCTFYGENKRLDPLSPLK